MFKIILTTLCLVACSNCGNSANDLTGKYCNLNQMCIEFKNEAKNKAYIYFGNSNNFIIWPCKVSNQNVIIKSDDNSLQQTYKIVDKNTLQMIKNISNGKNVSIDMNISKFHKIIK